MSLNTLPDELLLKVLHDFGVRDNKRDLISLARCSRRLYNLATPFLYKRIHDSRHSQGHVLPCLLRSLLRNRALGEHAEEMTILTRENPVDCISALTAADWALAKDAIAELYSYEIWHVWPAGNLNDDPDYSQADIEAVAPGAESRTQEYCAHWYACLADGRLDAVCALVLALLHGLSHLAVENWDGWDYGIYSVLGEDRDYVSRLMRGAANAQAQAIAMEAERRERDPLWDAYLLADVLPYLSSVEVDYHDLEYGMSIAQVLPFVLPPLVERFRVSSLADDGWEGAPGLKLGLKRLSILHSNISTEDLGWLIECCPRLEKLVYEHGGPLVGYTDLAPSLLMPSLRTVRGTLTELDLAKGEDTLDFGFDALSPSEVRLGSLRGFAKLKRLSLRVEHLIEGGDLLGPARLWEMLPRSLWRLTIKGDEEYGNLLDIIPDLQALLQRKEEAVPALRQIFLGDIRRKTESDDEQVRSLRNSCEAHGVHLFIQYPYKEQEENISRVLQGGYAYSGQQA